MNPTFRPNLKLARELLPVATIDRTRAEVVLASVTPYGRQTELHSIYGVFPKMVMVERNRHRALSLSDRSSRAVPPEKLIAEIRSGEGLAMPAKFRRRTKGMGGGEEFTGDELIACQLGWIEDALTACDAAERAIERDEAKETVNRRLDPYIYAHTLQTATRDGWLNFYGLRLDRMADPTIQRFAQVTIEAHRAAKPCLLQPGEWHLPYVDDQSWDMCNYYSNSQIAPILGFRMTTPEERDGKVIQIAKRLSAARCAHLSFQDYETGRRMTIERALAIYDQLITSRPIHASPTEHQAQVDERGVFATTSILPQGVPGGGALRIEGGGTAVPDDVFAYPGQSGNFCPGWRQARKMIEGEAVAGLPEGYEL